MKCPVIFAMVLVALATVSGDKAASAGPDGGPVGPLPPRPRPSPSYTIYAPFTISGPAPPSRLCLCFRKTCSVPGMYNGYHRIYNGRPSYGPPGPPGPPGPQAMGYLVYNGVLYQTYKC